MSTNTQADIGVVGMAVMGQNLALNIESRGHTVAVYNRTQSTLHEFVQRAGAKQLVPAASLAEFAASLVRPRKVLLMVQAGAAVDRVIADLQPHLEPGDILIDGGNSYFVDTFGARRRPARPDCATSAPACPAARRAPCSGRASCRAATAPRTTRWPRF